MTNLSTVDDFPNITRDKNKVYDHYETSYERIFLELFTVVGLMSVVANLLLIFVIIKYKKLRQKATNVIFLHLNIWQAVLLLVAPLTVRASMYYYGRGVPYTTFCAFYFLEINAFIAIILFLIMMICGGYVKIYHKNAYRKLIRFYKFFIFGVYVLFGCASFFTTQLCFNDFMVLFLYFAMLVVLVLIVLFLIVMNVIHAIKKRKLTNYNSSNIGLAMPNIFLLVWIPFLFFILLSAFSYINAPVTLIILYSLGFSSPVFNLIYLYFYDNDYNILLKQIFTCRCREYENEGLEDQSVSYDGINGVQIPKN